jgi:ABC-type antimicrobial peptide transport system permease subunit
MPPFVWWGALAVAALIGVISSFVPAWGASRRSIIEALRYTD